MKKKIITGLVLATALTLLFISGCAKQTEKTTESSKTYSVALFIPGVVAGSPTYEMMVRGAERAISEISYGKIKVIEGGYNQGEWLEKLTVIAATREYDLIVSTNPAMPAICDEISKQFPEQKFFLLDGFLEGNRSIYTFRYNQKEQGFLGGYFAGLVTSSTMAGANEDLKIGLVAGQEYPDMMQAILPGFKEGAEAVNSNISVDFRIVGNWYDAEKARSLAVSIYNSGADIILTIAGGANQGVIAAAKNLGKYVLMYDVSSYDDAPGVIAGSTVIRQEKASYEKIKEAIAGKMAFGTAEIADVKGGWISFDNQHPLFQKNTPKEVKDKLKEIMNKLETGALSLTMPVYLEE